MEAKIWCKSHRLKPERIVYDFQEKDPETKLVRSRTVHVATVVLTMA
jgi:hypothetical protein